MDNGKAGPSPTARGSNAQRREERRQETPENQASSEAVMKVFERIIEYAMNMGYVSRMERSKKSALLPVARFSK